MIHRFILGEIKIVLDVESGSIHVVDDLAYEGITLLEAGIPIHALGDALRQKYNTAAAKEVVEDLRCLINNNLLFSGPAEENVLKPPEFGVKSLCLNVAHACNLSCRYCFAGQGSFAGESSLMSREVGFKAIDFLLEKSGKRRNVELDFFGGEPLLNFPVIKAVTEYGERKAAIAGKKIKYTVTTNATELAGEKAAYIQAKKFCIVLSLDGRKEVNDFMRPYRDGRGSFSTIEPNMLRFLEERNHENYYVRGTYTALNPDFSNDVAFLAERGFKSISLEPVVGGEECEYSLKMEHLPQLAEEYEKVAELYLSYKNTPRAFKFFHFNFDLEAGPCLVKRIKGCGAGTDYAAVTPAGDIYPCHQFVGKEAFKLGKLGGELNEALVQEFGRANVFNKEKCSSCWARYYCGGGCLANAYNKNGDINKNDELGCELERKRLECAIYIKVKERMG